MKLFSRRCRCARAAASLCCRCCSFLFPFPPSSPWSKGLHPFLLVTTPRTSTSCCFSPTMWCLLQRVWLYSTRFFTRNKAERGVSSMKRAFPILSILTAILLAYALYQALVVAPADAQQGDVYRIIYYHVPSAWTAFLLFFINFIASIQYLANAKPSTKTAAKWIVIAIGVIGVSACFLPQVQRMLPTGMRPSAVA